MFALSDSIVGIITEFHAGYERRENIYIYEILSCSCCCLSGGKCTFYGSFDVAQTDTMEE